MNFIYFNKIRLLTTVRRRKIDQTQTDKNIEVVVFFSSPKTTKVYEIDVWAAL